MPEVFKAQTAPVSENVARVKHKTSPITSMSAFIMRPNGIKFETQAAQEEIILFLRQHFIVNLGWILITLILLLLPLFIGPVLLTSGALPTTLPVGYFVVIPLIWYIGVFGYVLVNFIHWYFNIYIVTNQRIVDIDWVNLLYKHFASTSLEKIQDVSYRQAGILGLFFNYGDVMIQTAGTEQNFEFASVPRADLVVRQINDLIKQLK